MALAKARVLILSRKEENAEEAITKIKESATQAGTVADVTFIQCDSGDLNMVKKVADDLNGQEGRMDIVSLVLVFRVVLGFYRWDFRSSAMLVLASTITARRSKAWTAT